MADFLYFGGCRGPVYFSATFSVLFLTTTNSVLPQVLINVCYPAMILDRTFAQDSIWKRWHTLRVVAVR
jgi:hypothetical protein